VLRELKGKKLFMSLNKHHAMKACCGSGVIAPDWVNALCLFTPRIRASGNHWVWVVPRADMDAVAKRKKFLPLLEI
jgi:hypothetical protein